VPSFDLTEKLKVNGPEEHPLYTFLKSRCSSPLTGFAPKASLDYDGLSAADVRWNFEKFLVDEAGRPVMRYSQKFLPLDISSDVEYLVSKMNQ